MSKYMFNADMSDPYNRPPLELGNGLIYSGCCVRIGPNGDLYIHTNSAHINHGISRVWVSEGYGSVYVDQMSDGPIVSMSIDGDETISAGKGILVGGSGGTSQTSIYFYDTRINRRLNMADPSDYARVASSGSNLWLSFFQVARTAA